MAHEHLIGKGYRWRCPICGSVVAYRIVETVDADGNALTRCEVCGCTERGPAHDLSQVASLKRPDSWRGVARATKAWR